MIYDVVIIGSGLGGLVCANILARKGMSVAVLERQSVPGGCLQSYTRGAFSYDTGMHYVGGLGEGQLLGTVFRWLGLDALPWYRLDADGFDRVMIGDKQFALAQGYEAFAEKLASCFPQQEAELRQYVQMLRHTAERTRMLYSGQARAEVMPQDMTLSAWSYLHTLFSDELLINVLSAGSQKIELRKDSLPLFNFAHSNSSYIESSWRLRGGGSQIADLLISQLRAMGGELLCRHEVCGLDESAEGLITAARCANGARIEGRTFICDAHPAVLAGLLTQDRSDNRRFSRRVGKLPNTSGMFTASLLLKPGKLRYFNYNQNIYKQANVWTYPQEPGVNGVMISCRVPDEGEEYARQIDLLTPMSWSEVAPWADQPEGRRDKAYQDMKHQKAQACIALAERALPGLSEITQKVFSSTPLTYRHFNLTPQGSAFGIRKDCHQPLLTYLSPRTQSANLLLTGQSLMLHGIEGVTLTALSSCAAIIGKKAIQDIVNQQ